VTHFFGAHTIDNGGIHMAARRAGAAGMKALQLFTTIPKYYGDKSSIKPERVTRFRGALTEAAIDPRFVMAHSAYVLNTATAEEEKYSRAKAGLAKELERSSALGIGQLCFHPGAALDDNREAAAELESARNLASGPDQLDDLELLDAHRLARLSAARTALQRAFSVLKRHRTGDRAAKAHWIAGVALYRTGHYRWAKDCFELSAAHYRLSREPVLLAQVLENLALVVKNEGRTAAALDLLDQAMRPVADRARRHRHPWDQHPALVPGHLSERLRN
jgi:tetratricopeptide (TPR) repeat protein